MPAGLLTNEGIGQQIDNILRTPISGQLPWSMIFFTNDIVPDFDTVLADLTEATFGGYTRLTLTRSVWTSPVIADGCAHSTWGTDAVIWTVTSGPLETIYGYAFIDVLGGLIRFVQRYDDADILPLTIGTKITLLPQYTLTSAECA